MLAVGVIMAVFCLALAFWEQRVLVFGILPRCSSRRLATGRLAEAAGQAAEQDVPGQSSELEADLAQLRRSPASRNDSKLLELATATVLSSAYR